LTGKAKPYVHWSISDTAPLSRKQHRCAGVFSNAKVPHVDTFPTKEDQSYFGGLIQSRFENKQQQAAISGNVSYGLSFFERGLTNSSGSTLAFLRVEPEFLRLGAVAFWCELDTWSTQMRKLVLCLSLRTTPVPHPQWFFKRA
jgi:hypothetical protein